MRRRRGQARCRSHVAAFIGPRPYQNAAGWHGTWPGMAAVHTWFVPATVRTSLYRPPRRRGGSLVPVGPRGSPGPAQFAASSADHVMLSRGEDPPRRVLRVLCPERPLCNGMRGPACRHAAACFLTTRTLAVRDHHSSTPFAQTTHRHSIFIIAPSFSYLEFSPGCLFFFFRPHRVWLA